VAEAVQFSHDWAETTALAGLRPLIKVEGNVKRHLWGILSFVKHPITNAATEGAIP
jgi:hypothetical protein